MIGCLMNESDTKHFMKPFPTAEREKFRCLLCYINMLKHFSYSKVFSNYENKKKCRLFIAAFSQTRKINMSLMNYVSFQIHNFMQIHSKKTCNSGITQQSNLTISRKEKTHFTTPRNEKMPFTLSRKLVGGPHLRKWKMRPYIWVINDTHREKLVLWFIYLFI